jgi:hypothetical protein
LWNVLCNKCNPARCLVNEFSIIASESNDVEVIEEIDTRFDLDVEEISSNEEECSDNSFDQEDEDFVPVGPENTDHSVLPYDLQAFASSDDENSSDNWQIEHADRTQNTDW